MSDNKLIFEAYKNSLVEKLDQNVVGMVVTIPARHGGWVTDDYPIGGKFHRLPEDVKVKIIRQFDLFHGTNVEGVTEDGHKMAFNFHDTKEQTEFPGTGPDVY